MQPEPCLTSEPPVKPADLVGECNGEPEVWGPYSACLTGKQLRMLAEYLLAVEEWQASVMRLCYRDQGAAEDVGLSRPFVGGALPDSSGPRTRAEAHQAIKPLLEIFHWHVALGAITSRAARNDIRRTVADATVDAVEAVVGERSVTAYSTHDRGRGSTVVTVRSGNAVELRIADEPAESATRSASLVDVHNGIPCRSPRRQPVSFLTSPTSATARVADAQAQPKRSRRVSAVALAQPSGPLSAAVAICARDSDQAAESLAGDVDGAASTSRPYPWRSGGFDVARPPLPRPLSLVFPYLRWAFRHQSQCVHECHSSQADIFIDIRIRTDSLARNHTGFQS